MGRLMPGDKVFDENGKVCHVVACSEIMHGRPCYEVSFSDGSKITADAEHLWQVNEYKPHTAFYYKARILKTEEMAGNTKHKYGSYNYRIPNISELQLPEQKLIIPPYVLGVWLADGSSHYASFTCNIEDTEIVQKVVG